MMRANRLAALLCTLILAGCASPTRVVISDQERVQRQTQRDEHADAQRSFSLAGRIAIRNGRDGGSGRFEWQQDGEVMRFVLSAPLSNQTWTLEGMPGSYVLTDSKGRQQQDADAKRLVFEASGWVIPMDELSYWIRAARAPEAIAGPAELVLAESGDLSSLRQAGWQVRFDRFSEVNAIRLPVKITAEQDAASVKVIIQRWE